MEQNMDTVITCIKCNNNYDAKDIQRDFRYGSGGKRFNVCVHCRGLRRPYHMTCDRCEKLCIHCDYIWLIKPGGYHSTCCDCLSEAEFNNIGSNDRAILDKHTRR